MAAPYKWFVPDASAGGDGDSYNTAYNDINTAFGALSSTYYILNIVPTLTGTIPASTIALNALKGTATTFRFEVRLTDSSGNVLADSQRFTLDGNNALTNIMTFVDCALWDISGIDFKRATSHNISFLTALSNDIIFRNGSSQLAGGNGVASTTINNRIALRSFDLLSNGVNGFSVGQTGGQLHVESCFISNNSGIGIYSLLLMTIKNCLINKNGSVGLRIANNYSNVMGNIFDANVAANILFDVGLVNGNYIRDNLITNSAIGINSTTGMYYGLNNAFYGNTENEKTTTGKSIIIGNTILTEDPYVDQANNNYNYKPSYTRRRVSVVVNGFSFGQTAGIPGADVYPQDFYLDKSVVSVTAGTLITVTLKHLAATLMTGLTLKGVACTDRTVTGANTLTFVAPDLSAGIGDVVGSFTGYDDYTITNGITAQAGASAPEAFLANAVAWGVQSVKVGWGASAGALTYRVFRDDVDVSGELRNVSTFIDSPVVAGTYSYVVKAYNEVDDTPSNTITLTKGAGGLATIYGVLSAIYRAMFNMQKIEKVGSTYYLNTYDDDNTTLVASCALKTFDAADIGNLAGTVTPSIRMKSAISGVGVALTGTIWDLVQPMFKKEFNTRKNEELPIGSGIIQEVVYDDNDTTKISQQALKTFNGNNLPSQISTTTPSQRLRSTV